MSDDRDPFEQLSREETEKQQWEEHEKQLRELEALLGEQSVINRRWDSIFKELK